MGMLSADTRGTVSGHPALLRGALTAVGVSLVTALISVLGARQSSPSAGVLAQALLEDLIAANRILAQEGIVDGFGHVSVRHDRHPGRFVMARSLAPALVTAADLIEYNLDATPVGAEARAQYSERAIHAEIYRARPDVRAVVHDHSPAVVPFTVSQTPLRAVYHMAGFIGSGLPVFEIRAVAGMTEMLVNNAQRGRALARTLGDRPAVLMRGHGVAVVGSSLPIAVGRSIYLELNARIQAQAIALGGVVTYLDPEETRKILESGENRGYDRAWEGWKAKAMPSRVGAVP